MKQWMAAVLVACAVAFPRLSGAAETVLNVQVQEAQLRGTPSFLGKPVATVAYGDRVSVLASQGDWRQVRSAKGSSGWLHQSALTAKTIKLKAGAQDVARTASGEELALAGKGFNSDVEADFKGKNPKIDFAWIDRMEQIKVSATEAGAFLKEGGVSP